MGSRPEPIFYDGRMLWEAFGHRTTKPKKTCDFVFQPKNQTPTPPPPTNLRTGNLKITIFDHFDLRAARRAEAEPNSMIPAQKSTQIQFFRAPSAQIISLFDFLKVFLRFPLFLLQNLRIHPNHAFHLRIRPPHPHPTSVPSTKSQVFLGLVILWCELPQRPRRTWTSRRTTAPLLSS